MNKIRKTIILTISTFCYIGYLPLIPGTFGSIAGVFLYLLIKDSVINFTSVTGILMILGFLVTGQAEKILNQKDARCIVIDEVSGMLLSFMFMPFDIRLVIIGFLLFRILDSLKPFPAGRFQNLNGNIGVMGDDIIAAIYTNVILQIVLRFASFRIS